MESTALLPDVRRVHFIGIGGSGMCSLAEILYAMGYEVTGSDDNESDNVTRLRALGIPVALPLGADNIGNPEAVIYTVAVNESHPEMQAARALGVPVIERAALLGLLTRHTPRSLAVSGTHGKTTTTSMIAQILMQAELDPTLVIGGRLPLIDANGRAGKSDILVCEACEFKDHYLEMAPAVSVILNVDADHLEYFGSLDNIIRSFHRFSELTTKTLLVNGNDANTMRAVEGIEGKTIIRFGTTPDCDWYAANIASGGPYGRYDLYHGGAFVTHIRLSVPGRHNLANSGAAAAAASLLGAAPEQIAAGLESFGGAGRRFEKIGTAGGVTIVDDYAHHPTEIAATLEAAKSLPHRRVWAVFQPFTFSRTARHLDGFADALSAADVAVVSDIMGSREVNTWNVSSSQITDRLPGSHYIPDFEGISRFVADNAADGDLVVTMGGGDIYKCARMIRKKLEEKAAT